MQYRKIKAIDRAAFRQDILNSTLVHSPASALDVAVHQYDSQLGNLLNKHAPLQSRSIVVRPVVPWYNEDIGAAKRKRRQLERQWRRTMLTVHRDLFKAQRQAVRDMIRQARSQYYNQKIQQCRSDQGALFKVIGQLAGKSATPILPSHTSAQDLAASFSDFFIRKITTIRERLVSQRQSTPAPYHPVLTDICDVHLSTFTPASIEEVTKIVTRSASKTCALDPIPTSLLADCLHELAPAITNIVNLSLSSGCFPAKFKKALVTPLIKKPSLDPQDVKNYRPVSNLSFVSKVVERVVAARLDAYITENGLHENMQSAYRLHHGVESALLKVHDDIIGALDRREAVMLIFLDLSAAFDTIDHDLLLRRLHDDFGIRGQCLAWLQSYVRARCQVVRIGGVLSADATLNFGVPQGSVLGPILFILYTKPMASIARRHDLQAHFYADDSQLYVSFSPQVPGDEAAIARKVEACLSETRRWMLANMLKQNDDKTEFIIVCSTNVRKQISGAPLTVGDASIPPSPSVRNLGVTFDAEMTLHPHFKKVCQAAYLHLRNIALIRPALTDKAAECLIHAFITSRLDFCNSLYAGLPSSSLNMLQAVQNAAARLLTRNGKYDHVTPILCQLHWLPITSRIQYKILLLVYKALNGLAPVYVRDMLRYRNARPGLRSTGRLLDIPRTKTLTYGNRAFSTVGPRLWNSLPADLKTAPSLNVFKANLKTHLFKTVFGQ